MTAPAAKANGNEMVSSDTVDSGPAPSSTAPVSRTAATDQSTTAYAVDLPWARRDAAPTSDSGRFDAKIAASRAKLPPVASSEIPSAAFSGTPSRVTAASRASPAPPLVEADVAGRPLAAASLSQLRTAVGVVVLCDVAVQDNTGAGEHHRAGRQTCCRSEGAALLERLLEQLERQGGDERARGEGQDRGQQSLGEGEPRPEVGTDHQGAAGDDSKDERAAHARRSTTRGGRAVVRPSGALLRRPRAGSGGLRCQTARLGPR